MRFCKKYPISSREWAVRLSRPRKGAVCISMAFSSTCLEAKASEELERMTAQSRAKRVASTTMTISSTEAPATCQVSGDERRSRQVMLDFSLIADLPGVSAWAFAEVSNLAAAGDPWESGPVRLASWPGAIATPEGRAGLNPGAGEHKGISLPVTVAQPEADRRR